MAHRFPIFDGLGSLFRENIYPIFDGLGSLFRENIYVVCDISYYVIFVCYYFSPSFIVINDNFHFKLIHAHQTEETCVDKNTHLCNK
jgi:hypothetical protein